MFLKTKVTLPGFAVDLVGSRKKNSPPLTWIAVPCVLAEEPALPLAPEPALDEVAACVPPDPEGYLIDAASGVRP
jgi:hypothetical protein